MLLAKVYQKKAYVGRSFIIKPIVVSFYSVAKKGSVKRARADWIFGDDSGVVVVPKEQAVEIANRALDVKEKENRIREEIKRGKVLSVVMELEKWEKL